MYLEENEIGLDDSESALNSAILSWLKSDLFAVSIQHVRASISLLEAAICTEEGSDP